MHSSARKRQRSPPVQDSDRPVALVTGTRKGLGRHLAVRLVEQGYRVVGCSRVEGEPLAGCLQVACDVSREPDVLHLFSVIREKFGRLDAAINNAGVAVMNHCLLTPVSTLDDLYAVNVRGTFLVSREAAKMMRRRKFGRIVNFTSIAAPLVIEGEMAYSVTKAAVENLTYSFSKELAASKITVNAVGPGPVDTDMLHGLPAAKMAALLDMMSIKEMQEPDDVWNLVRFFLLPESSRVTGQVLYLGGPS